MNIVSIIQIIDQFVKIMLVNGMSLPMELVFQMILSVHVFLVVVVVVNLAAQTVAVNLVDLVLQLLSFVLAPVFVS